MTQRVEVPGMGTVEFPDGMSDADMSAAIKRTMAAQKPPSGVMKGLNDLAAGGAQFLAHALPSGVVSGVNKATQYVNDLPGIGPVTQALGMVPATAADLDKQITDTDANYALARARAGKTGFDWGRAGGQVCLALRHDALDRAAERGTPLAEPLPQVRDLRVDQPAERLAARRVVGEVLRFRAGVVRRHE